MGLSWLKMAPKCPSGLRNYPDPSIVIQKYGADAVRLYMMHSPAVKADDLCFAENGVELVLRQILIPLWNAYSFFIDLCQDLQLEAKRSACQAAKL